VSLLPPVAVADVVTGTVTPATAKAVVVDASGKTIAELKAGALPAAAGARTLQGPVPGTRPARAGIPEPLRTRHRQRRLQLTGARS